MLDISLPARIEAVLYLKGKPLTNLEISEILGESKSSIEEALFDFYREHTGQPIY